MPHNIFITGGTGYMGQRLIARLLAAGHRVTALIRPGSERKLPPGCTAVLGDALSASTFAAQVAPADTFIQLVGVAHPSPAKAKEFRSVDRAAAFAAIEAAVQAQVAHFIYVSVAQPAPVMKAYLQARAECEDEIRRRGLNATILRPWYVLGPGHRWPLVLRPAYWLLERIPATRDGARRLGLVTLDQMTTALVRAVERPASGVRIVEVPEIRENPHG